MCCMECAVRYINQLETENSDWKRWLDNAEAQVGLLKQALLEQLVFDLRTATYHEHDCRFITWGAERGSKHCHCSDVQALVA